ncbi:MAG: hypothetical protein ACLGG7_10885 [Bacteriovoracia bacterium]
MSDPKKDLTRIEDLGEFLHELDDTEDFLAPPEFIQEETPEAEPPDLPPETPFGDFSTDADGASVESFGTDTFQGDAFEEASFSSEMPTDADLEESQTPFELSEETEVFEPPALEPAEEFQELSEDAPITEEVPEPQTETVSEARNNYSFESDSELSQMKEELKTYAPKEDFSETRRFAESAMVTDTTAECNPAFSVMARGIRFIEDSEEILDLLKEAGFPEDMRAQFQRQIAFQNLRRSTYAINSAASNSS